MITQWNAKRIFLLVVATTIAQALHIVEHIAQVYQHAVLGLSLAMSHGLLFFLDFEWNHFAFDILIYLSLLTLIFFKAGIYDSLRAHGFSELRANGNTQLFVVIFTIGLVLQGYHGIEHVIRVIQFTQSGCAPCLGFLGNFVDDVYLHASFNFAVYALTTIPMVKLGLFRRAKHLESLCE